MQSFDEIISDIKSLKIQGATDVALGAILALNIKSHEVSSKQELLLFEDIISNTRPTEPGMRNLLHLYLKKVSENLSNSDEVYEEIVQSVKSSAEKIYEFGARVIKDGMSIFTVCHSSNVVGSMKKAWEQGKKFQVFNAETRPHFQGRKTAKSLAEFGIPVTHFVDNAAYRFIKKCDIFMFGADSINSMGDVVNKVGTHNYANLSKRFDLTTYCCTSSIKFNSKTHLGEEEEIEYRDTLEIWDYENLNLTILNPAFDKIEKEVVDGIICEWGVMSPVEFVNKALRYYAE
ncbi:MAG: ribose 1,5-bisphosphate isomerase [Patescibacteria group bacterium]